MPEHTVEVRRHYTKTISVRVVAASPEEALGIARTFVRVDEVKWDKTPLVRVPTHIEDEYVVNSNNV